MNLPDLTAASGLHPLLFLVIGLVLALGAAVATFFFAPKVTKRNVSKETLAIGSALAGVLVFAVAVPAVGGIAQGQQDSSSNEKVTAVQSEVERHYNLTLDAAQAEQLITATPLALGKSADGEDITVYGSTLTWDETNQWLQSVFLYKQGDTFHLAYQGGASNIVELPVQEAPAEEAPAEEAPAEEAPAEEAPAEEAPAEEAPAEEAPTEEAPTEETPTEETPAEEAPVETEAP